MKLEKKHLTLLTRLVQNGGKCKYVQFRYPNPWRRESYFDAQVTWLTQKGLVVFGPPHTIQITAYGIERLEAEVTANP